MDAEIHSLKSGRQLGLQLAPFSSGNKLRKVIASELRGVDIKVDRIDPTMDVGKLGRDGINTIKDIVCALLASDAVENAFFECAARCTLDGAKITRDSFEAPNARPDFLPVAQEVIKFNLTPFFVNLDLRSLVAGDPTSSAPPIESGK